MTAPIVLGGKTLYRVEVSQERFAEFYVLAVDENFARDAAAEEADALGDWDYDSAYTHAYGCKAPPDHRYVILDDEGGEGTWEQLCAKYPEDPEDKVWIHPDQGKLL